MWFPAVLLIVFIIIMLNFKKKERDTTGDSWDNFANGVITINGDVIYVAGRMNRKAKRARVVTDENFDVKLSFIDGFIVYDNRAVEYKMPVSAIESIVSGREHYSRIKKGDEEQDIFFNLKPGSVIKMVVESRETFMRESREHYNNVVDMNSFRLKDRDFEILLDTLRTWIA